MLVYHGSTVQVQYPIVKAGRPNLDFGQGFYVTDMKEQAERWAKRLGRQQLETPILNIYELDLERIKREYKVLRFESYNREWLEFIVSSRQGKCPWKEFDLIEGGVANDRVIDTVESYMSGMASVEKALGQLSLHRPNNQFCLLNQTLVDNCLHFISVELL